MDHHDKLIPASRRKSRLGIPVLLIILGLMIFIPVSFPSATTQAATQSNSKTVQYPTYQFASWAGGGTKLTNDTFTQEAYMRSEEHTSELQSRLHLVCRLLL